MPLRKIQNTIYPCKHLFTASYLAVFFCRYSRISYRYFVLFCNSAIKRAIESIKMLFFRVAVRLASGVIVSDPA
ncbi:TPA: hypothetical protein I8Y22_004358 [Raoultella planticola]|nr:hypothetical protein [Raoultella planticola]